MKLSQTLLPIAAVCSLLSSCAPQPIYVIEQPKPTYQAPKRVVHHPKPSTTTTTQNTSRGERIGDQFIEDTAPDKLEPPREIKIEGNH
jgi:hypothetical protein